MESIETINSNSVKLKSTQWVECALALSNGFNEHHPVFVIVSKVWYCTLLRLMGPREPGGGASRDTGRKNEETGKP